MASNYNVAVPVKLDAFVFNRDICDPDPDQTKLNARIASINQPNYTFLRFENNVLQSDLVPPVDVHDSQPSNINSRVTNLGTGTTRENRLGVYLHWIVPRSYRVPPALAQGSNPPQSGGRKGASVPAPAGQFPNPPTRWLVIRKLDPQAATTLPANSGIPAVQAWVVESDLTQRIDHLTDPNADLQVDVSPYINSSTKASQSPSDISIEQQAEIFIGGRSRADEWVESGDSDGTRAHLGLLNSSNQLFPDYQPHNSNVFSLIDTFEYGEPGSGTCLTDAVADYYVIGWHWDPDNQDPFGKNYLKGSTRGASLTSWSMAIQTPTGGDPNVTAWLASADPTAVVCHGAMYGVEWHDHWNPPPQPAPPQPSQRPANTPGDDFTTYLDKSNPVAIGTTPTDAMLAFVEAATANTSTSTTQPDDGQLLADLRQIAALLRAQDDSVAAVQAGEDEVQNYNFSKQPGGTQWAFPTIDGQPLQPPTLDQRTSLRELNAAQALLDAAHRSHQKARWDLFAVWWRFVTDFDNNNNQDGPHPHDQDYINEVAALDSTRSVLGNLLTSQKDKVHTQKQALEKAASVKLKAMALPEFTQAKDPTLFVHGAKAGWPDDFLNPLQIRIDTQIPAWTTATKQPEADSNEDSDEDSEDGDGDDEFGLNCLPAALRNTAAALVREFQDNAPQNPTPPAPPGPTTFYPLYHDQGSSSSNGGNPPSPTAPWRDRWNATQPWFPLFVEWEVEYFHLDYEECWALEETTARQNSQNKLRYAIKDGLNLSKSVEIDSRTFGGRILLLPQPAYSLVGQLKQLFNSTPTAILNSCITATERANLLAGAASLPFLSAPLDGFTAHLVTMLKGTHLKPNARMSGNEKPAPIDAAWDQSDSQRVNLDKSHLHDMGVETDLTPYGSEVQPGLYPPTRTPHCPFKPATHGQFRFTRLNIVDKFGQVATALDPSPLPPGADPPLFYPCLSEYFEPQTLPSSDVVNTIIPLPKSAPTDACTFAQVPPQLNQPARLNACFLMKEDDSTRPNYWRPVVEWDNPIWGFLLVNYVDNGIQFFTSEGVFYREVRVYAPDSDSDSGSESGNDNPPPSSGLTSSISPQWLPFANDGQSTPSTQLDRLIQLLDEDSDFLSGFISMATAAAADVSGHAGAAPTAYAQFTQSLVGRPLALANISVSFEVAADPLADTSIGGGWPDSDPGAPSDVTDYNLPFKLGDAARPYDGLVGYFKAKTTLDPKTSAGDELDLSSLYTSYYSDQSSSHDNSSDNSNNGSTVSGSFQPIDPSTFSKIQPAWIPRLTSSTPPVPVQDTDFENQRNNLLTTNAFGCILDPFTPLHVYSGGSIQPITALSLAPWTWQSALQRMTLFFRLGPMLLADGDVPAYDATKKLTDGYVLAPPSQDFTIDLKAASPLRFPGVLPAEWSWLQPYLDANKLPAFNALSLGDVPTAAPGYQKGPFTVVEGFLQLKEPAQNTAPTSARAARS